MHIIPSKQTNGRKSALIYPCLLAIFVLGAGGACSRPNHSMGRQAPGLRLGALMETKNVRMHVGMLLTVCWRTADVGNEHAHAFCW